MSVAPPEGGQNRIMIYGPKPDGTYIVEFKTADGEALAISVPAGRPAAPRGKLSRRKAVECCRIVDQNLLPDRRIDCPFGQLVDLRAIVAGIRWRKILTRLAAARMRPV